MKGLEDKICEKSKKIYPYHETHLIADDIKREAFEHGALWMKEVIFKNLIKQLRAFTFQEFPGGPNVRLLDDSQIEALLNRIDEGK